MPYLGSRTVADCQALALALHPKVRGLRAAYDRVRPQWEARDLFGAQRYARDLSHLESRWRTAVKSAQKVRIPRQHGVSTTFADKPYAKMVRAVRQGGADAPPRGGDLHEMSVRLRRVYAKLRPAVFGYDASDPYASAMTASGAGLAGSGSGLTKSVADCAQLVGQYGEDVRKAIARSASGRCADWDGALVLLALKAGDPSLSSEPPEVMAQLIASNEDCASTPAGDVYDQLVKTIGDWLPSGGAASGASSAIGFDWTSPVQSLQAWAGATQSLQDCKDLIANYSVQIPALGDRLHAANDAWQKADPSGLATFTAAYAKLVADWGSAVGPAQAKIASADPTGLSSSPAPTEYAALLAAAQEYTSLTVQLDVEAHKLGAVLPTAPAAVQPPQSPSSAFLQQTSAAIAAAKDAATGLKNETKSEWDDVAPWVKGGVVVAAIGVIGYALAQIATITGALKSEGTRRHA